MKTKDLTDKQIQEQINALEEENRNTKRLSMGRGHGWGDDAIEKRRNKILHLNSILFARRVEKTKPTPKKQGLSRTWDSKAKRWVYHYTKRTKKAKLLKGKSIPKPLEELLKEARKHKTATSFKKWWQTQAEDPFSHWRGARISKVLSDAKLVKGGFPDYKAIFELAKKQPDTKLSQHDKLLLAGKYKIRGKPKEVRKLGKAVTKGVKKTKKKMNISKDYEVQEVLGVFDIYFRHEHIGTRPTREEAIKYIKAHKESQTKPKQKKKKRAKGKSQQRTLFRGL